jgi:hypothetical protein
MPVHRPHPSISNGRKQENEKHTTKVSSSGKILAEDRDFQEQAFGASVIFNAARN